MILDIRVTSFNTGACLAPEPYRLRLVELSGSLEGAQRLRDSVYPAPRNFQGFEHFMASLPPVLLLGIDPGLRFTGWGMVEVDGNRLRHVGDGVIATDNTDSVPLRLKFLHDALTVLMARFRPDEAAVEETYVNRNGAATLKLGYARGVALLAPALIGIPVLEYGAMRVKQSVVGTGAATKDQVQMMVRRLLPGATLKRADAADALAVAICHAHHRASRGIWAAGTRMA